MAFDSNATKLVSGDTNGQKDVFVRDRETGDTIRASVSSFSAQATGGPSGRPAISGDARFLAFESTATNLVSGDTNSAQDIFVRDLITATTARGSARGVTGATDGPSFDPAISADGRFVAFASSATDLVSGDTNRTEDVYLRNRTDSTTTRVSLTTGSAQSTGGGFNPAVSADGRFVAFQSAAADLVAGDTNAQLDVFVRDRSSGSTTRVSVASGGAQATGGGSFAAAISGDGRFVAFDSLATNLVSGDTNGLTDVFVRDRGASAGFIGFWKRTHLRCARGGRDMCIVSGRLRIANPGFRRAASSRVDFYLSTNRRLDRRDRRLGRRALAPLNAGASRALRLRRALPRAMVGRFLIARLDATDRVDEPNEKDNVVVSKRLRRR